MKSSIQKLWDSINKPNNDKIAFAHWKKNVYLIKDSEGKIGFLLSEVDIKCSFPSLINLDIEKSKKKILKLKGKKNRDLCNNIIIVARHSRFSELLVVTIETLFNSFPTAKTYSTNDLKRALQKARELWKTEGKNNADIIGCFGELSWLRRMIKLADSEDIAIDYVKSWEGEEKRENIDFRYTEAGVCIEVKCTTLDERKHSFKGLEQITLPIHYSEGYILSCSIKFDTENGESNFDVFENINEFLTENKWLSVVKVLEKKATQRGPMCFNDDQKFSVVVPGGMKLYNFNEVPHPPKVDDVYNVSWEATLNNTISLSEQEEAELINRIN